MVSGSIPALPHALPESYKRIALAILAALFVLYWWQPGLMVLGVAALPLLLGFFYLASRLMDGDAQSIMLLWAGIFPLGYYFLSFPSGGAIINFDRVVAILLAVGIALCPKDKWARIPDLLRHSAWAWLAFLVAALLSILAIQGPVHGAVRLWLEAFVCPAVVGCYVVACFPVRSHLRTLHWIICVVSIYSAAIGAAEVILAKDFLPLPGAGDYFATVNSEGFLLWRGNGPYGSNNSFGLIGLLTFCMLGFLRKAGGEQFPGWQRALHRLGTSAALLQLFLPLFRSMELTLALIFVLDLFRDIRRREKVVRVIALALMGITVLTIYKAVPEFFDDRVSNSGSINARIAQQKQNLRIFLSHPVFGVGFSNFYQAASNKGEFQTSYGGEQSLDTPHNTLAEVVAETGAVGGISYILSQCLLVLCFWRQRRSGGPAGKLAWTFFVYLFLSYWITGLSLGSGYYSDLNLWYVFCVAVIYKYSIQDRVEVRS